MKRMGYSLWLVGPILSIIPQTALGPPQPFACQTERESPAPSGDAGDSRKHAASTREA